MAILQTTLITKADIQVYRDISNAIEDARLNAVIVEAQWHDVRPLLGDPLWNAFVVAVPDGGVYDDLLNGKEYEYRGQTIYFEGIKPIIAYYTLARIYQHGNFQTTQYGINTRFGESSNSAEQSTISQLKRDTRAIALSFVDGLTKFLETNADVYPLYRYSGNIKRSSFRFNKV